MSTLSLSLSPPATAIHTAPNRPDEGGDKDGNDSQHGHAIGCVEVREELVQVRGRRGGG